jgi:hypothetical protein
MMGDHGNDIVESIVLKEEGARINAIVDTAALRRRQVQN